MGVRDERYEVFSNTRSYRCRDEDLESETRPQTLDIIAQLRTQRDELDAIETFARVVAAEVDLTVSEILELSRIVADESRHVVIGELALESIGLEPTEIPIGTIGALLRRGVSPVEGLLQISMIGEVGNLAEIARVANVAEEECLPKIAAWLRLVHRDETHHIRYGQKLLKRLTGNERTSDLRDEALEITNRYLRAMGFEDLPLKEAAKLIGE